MTRCEICHAPAGRPQARIMDGRLMRLCADCMMVAGPRLRPRYGLPFVGLLAILATCMASGFIIYLAKI